MTQQDPQTLAINGGPKTREVPFPSVGDASGRSFGKEELALLEEAVFSGCLNRFGGAGLVRKFEEEFSERYRIPFAQASTSGSSALHLAVWALDLEPGDEVITAPITDLGTVIGIVGSLAVPTFADVDSLSGNITAETIRQQITPKTKAILVVHLFGLPCDMDSIMELAAEHNLAVIEDCAQAHLAEYKGKLVGTFGEIGCFSLQQSKQISAGDGGICITSDENLQRRMALLSDKGWPRTPGGPRGHLFFGLNYRMNETTGAVGLAQTRKADQLIARRRETAGLLASHLKESPGLLLPEVGDTTPSWWNFTFQIEEPKFSVDSPAFAMALQAEGIPFGCGYIPNAVFEYPVVAEKITWGKSQIPWSLPQSRPGIKYDIADYPGTRAFLSKGFVFNWNEGITESDVEDMAKGIRKVAEAYRF